MVKFPPFPKEGYKPAYPIRIFEPTHLYNLANDIKSETHPPAGSPAANPFV